MADEGAGTGAFTPGAGAGALTPGAGAGTLAPGAGTGALTETEGAGTGTVVPWEGAGTGTDVAGAGTGGVELLPVVKPAGAGTGAVTAAVGGAAAGAVAGEPAPGVGAEALRVVVELGAGVSEPVDRVRTDSGASTGEGAFQLIRLGNTKGLHAFAATPSGAEAGTEIGFENCGYDGTAAEGLIVA